MKGKIIRVGVKLRYFIFSFFICLTLSSQNFKIEKLDIKDGLLDNSVRNIIQDKEGYLWFGTLNGLSRFDGENFKNYKSIPGDTTSLANSRMIKIKEDRYGYIWCWSDHNTLQRLDPKTNRIVNLQAYIKEISIKDFKIVSNGDVWVWGDYGCVRIKTKDKKGAVESDVFTIENRIDFIFEDQKGAIWVGTDKGIIRIDLSNKKPQVDRFFKDIKFTSFSLYKNTIWLGTQSNGIFKYALETNTFDTLRDLNQKINNRPIFCIKHLNSKTILLGSDKFLFELSLDNYTLTAIYKDEFNGISKIFIDSFNDSWLITRERGIFKYTSSTKTVAYYGLKSKERDFLGIPDRLKILEDSNKNIWIGIHGSGLFFYNRFKNEFINYRYNLEKVESISSDIVLSLFEDSSKNLWVGTTYGGVTKINLSKKNFIWHTPIKNAHNFFENEIRASVEDSQGNLWLGSKGGKIFCYKNDNLLYTLPDDLSNENRLKLENTNVYSLFIDHADNLWVGTRGKGLFVLKDIINSPLKNIKITHFDNKKLKVLDNVYSIVQDENKTYWIGSEGSGLTRLTDPFINPKTITYTYGKATNQLVSNNIRYLFFDKDQNLWIGSSDGLNILPAAQLNKANKRFISIESKQNDKTSLSHNAIDYIFQASDHSIYVATMGGGLNILTYKDFKSNKFIWRHLNEDNGLFANKVFAVQEDSENNIWISTNLGINKYYTKQDKFEHFLIEKDYGLNYFTESCVLKISNGDFLFGHHNGFVTFNPKHIIKDTTSYPIVLSRIFINGSEVLPSKSKLISKNIAYEKGIALSYKQNTIRLDFSVLDFKHPKKIQYSYKLDNFDENWSARLTTNSAIYQNLPYGKYTFLLKATNSDGIELPEILKFKINITPPFFKSTLGYVLIVLFTGGVFFIFLYLYKKQISAKHEVLFSERLNDKKLKYYTNISHEFKTPLTLISCYLQEVVDDKRLSKDTRYNTKQIQKSTTYLLDLVEQILDFRKIREDKMRLSLKHINIVNFIQNICNEFKPLADKEAITLIFNPKEKAVFGHIDIKVVKKVMYNMLSNAIKFTSANKKITIVLDFHKTNDVIKLRIKDEGIGISIEDQKNLFERFSKSENSSGIGLFYVKELILCHKGTIAVESDLGEGTCFTITLPVHKKYYSKEDVKTTEVIIDDDHLRSHLTPIKTKTSDNVVKKHKNKTMLIIEDNQDMQRYLCKKFDPLFNVITAVNGEEGVKCAIHKLPDIIICDVMMPVMNGIETIKLLRENFNTCHIPIILLTANSSEQKKIEGIKIGADDFINKPFNFNHLRLKVDALIAQRDKIIKSFTKNPELSLNIITNSEDDKNFIEKVKQLVEESEGGVNVNIIGAEMGFSRTGFYTKIKDITGESPHEFIKVIQMKKAALLLKSTNYTITEIASICGFGDGNYFSKVFKKHFKKSPKAYQIDHKA